MAKFCGKCGSPLNDTAVFCGSCGAQVPAGPPAPPAQSTAGVPPEPAYTPVADTAVPNNPVTGFAPGPAIPPGKKSNTLLKVIIGCVVLLFVGTALAVGGMWYAAQKIKEKANAAAAQSPGLASVMGAVGGLAKSVASDDSPTEFKGDPCRFLSTQEVSQAIGITIIRAEGQDDGCSYIAKGDPADMTAKHMSSMVAGLGGPGVDAKTQKTIQGLAGSLFSQQEAQDKDLSAQAAKGEVPVLGISFTVGNAEAQMKLNRSSFRYVTGGAGSAASSGSGDLDGIGDEAYLAGGSMLLVRKGETIARFMYTGCPCNTDNIKPLAKLAASRL
jgi:zinc-ribbon domain